MTIPVGVILALLFVIWLVLAVIHSEFKASDFWWKGLIAVAVLVTLLL